MRIFSTFTGIGGFELGIQNAFKGYTKTQQADADSGHSANNSSDTLQEWGQSATCVGYSEIDKYAISVYERNFPNVRNYGDITKINADELPDFDCLVGGFPCQAFSIVGHLRGTPRPEVFPIGENSEPTSELPGHYTNTLTTRYYGGQANGSYISEGKLDAQETRIGTLRTHKDGNGFREMQSGLAPTIPARAREDGSGQPVMSYGLSIRRLTPMECERLQGFPDNWTKYGQDEHGVRIDISDTQRYKMCGNAVTTNVIQAVFENILRSK